MNKSIENSICYYCGEPATSPEHIPPKSFFPDDAAYRKHLITVPACRIHNEVTSRDDEYVRNIILMSDVNNALARSHYFDKAVRSFDRSPKLFIQTTEIQKGIEIDGQQSKAIFIDRVRMDLVLRKIGYGLYFHEFKTVWDRKIVPLTPHLSNDFSEDQLSQVIPDYKTLFPEGEYKGSNPQVFKYCFSDADINGTRDKILQVVLYEGFTVVYIPVVPSKTN